MAFSGALTLTDLNDFLGPSQACIKPVEGKTPEQVAEEEAQAQANASAASTQIAIDHDGSYYESSAQLPKPGDSSKPRARTKLETAEISLNDCLACSGCVTSAESVLITMQSHEEMKRAIQQIRSTSQPHLILASISPQSLASLSAKLAFDSHAAAPLPPRTLLHRIRHFLSTQFAFDYVIDTTFARHLSIKEHQREFFERRNNSNRKRKRDPVHELLAAAGGSSEHVSASTSSSTLPMLASACPGWICYAEKTHGELLPFISRTKSPQQISGLLAKRFIASRLGITAQTSPSQSADSEQPVPVPNVYHVTVMPCYDKKLEASRQDFIDELTGSKEVDCVLTTGELDKLMSEHGFDLSAPVPGEQQINQGPTADLSLNDAFKTGAGSLRSKSGNADAADVVILPHFPTLLDHPGSSSGGYLFDLMRAVWLEWLGENWDTLPAQTREAGVLPKLDVKIIRTSDFTEYVLRVPVSSAAAAEDSAQQQPILFRGAQCYGFRNLQNLVRKVQRQTGVRSAKGAAGRLVDAQGKAVRGRASRGRGRGMVRRGRGGSTASGTDSGVASGTSTPVAGVEDDEEEYGYDYVEVMACPGGCVNGGGQLRPPTGSEVDGDGEEEAGTVSKSCSKTEEAKATDPEGFTAGWANGASGDASQDMSMLQLNGEEKEIKGWQGTSKEWVRRVERAYWEASEVAYLPATASATADGTGTGTSTPATSAAAAKRQVRTEDQQRILDALVSLGSPKKALADASTRVNTDSLAYADVLAQLVSEELVAISSRSREALFRTEYHAVKDELVSGLAVQW